MDWKCDTKLRSVLSECVLHGYKHSETLNVVQKRFEQYPWCLRTLKRRLKHFEIKKNDVTLNSGLLIHAIKTELRGPAKLFGYRALHQHLRLKYGLKVKRDDVYHAMKVLDPSGLLNRATTGRRKKLQRRQFISKGPNWMWSVDGHDKLMGLYKHEFPLAIHGCIDSFSRKIIWLRAWPGNSSPRLPGRLYFAAVKQLNTTPAFVRTDRGDENGLLRQIHNFFRKSTDGFAHIYGSSMTNQVIERFWRDFRERHGDFFRSYVRNLVSTGLYNDKDTTSRALLAVLMIPVLQAELDQFKLYWNTHRIRAQKIKRPCGIPNYMFEYPEEYGFRQCGLPVDLLRQEFLAKKLNYEETMDFISSKTITSLHRILLESHLFPVTLGNMIHAYQLLYIGCRTKGIQLNVT